MDIIDILIAKKKSFTAETERLIRQAREAMSKANEVADKIDQAEQALSTATEANERASAIAGNLEEMQTNVTEAATNIVNSNAVSNVSFSNSNSSSAKIIQSSVTKNGTDSTYTVSKNYTSTGQNEDGAMTQKAITTALNNLQNQINNGSSSSSSGGGNINGNITEEDAGALVVVDENGQITASSIQEKDLVLLQINNGSYYNEEAYGIEIDYTNKTVRKLWEDVQDESYVNLGSSMFSGRKRCIVNENGEISSFINSETLNLENKRIMVYQPAFYYLRVPISTTLTATGVKINKEQLYISSTKQPGYTLHPAFYDDNGDPIKFILLPAFEGSALRANGSFETNDAQDINFETDKLVSAIGVKPISGKTQNFTLQNAIRMAENNGDGWHLTDIKSESLQQMLMIIDFVSLNMQNAFQTGPTNIPDINGQMAVAITGSTIDLATGKASSTTATNGSTTRTSSNNGQCSITYRGVENPYGNLWRFVDGIQINEEYRYQILKGNDIISLSFKAPTTPGWISRFGYDEKEDWLFLPIEVNSDNANSNLPVGDYLYSRENTTQVNCCIIGGYSNSKENSGIFYYGLNLPYENYHYQSDSARVMFKPTANSAIEGTNYDLWYDTYIVNDNDVR